MSERFTERARKVIVLGQDEARRLRHGHIGTEHLLLGLLRDEQSVGAQALSSLDVTLDEVRGQVGGIVGYGEEGAGVRALLTPRSKKVMQLAQRESLQLGDVHVGGEHVLLGLLRESEGVAARVLLDLGVDLDTSRREVIRRLPGGEERDPPDESGRRLEEEERDRRPFWARVAGIRAELNLPRPLPVTVDVRYSYLAPGGAAGVEPGDVAGLISSELSEPGSRSLEVVVTGLGERLLAALREVREVTVAVSGLLKPEDPPAPTFSVSSTFRR